VIKNLKLVDIATRQDFPNKGCTNIMVDGSYNRLEGVELYSTGSSPYGYGELFGKGGGAKVPLKKHCGCLVRGDHNHVLNCKIIHHGFGHCLFMQGADYPVIEGCYIEGETRSTDLMLAERGPYSVAQKMNYMTGFGYPIPPGYTLACTEEGIRAYITGNTMVDGVRYKRGTSNVTVKDCYVKNARAGVTLTHAKGFKHVENCTVIGCERGYAIGSGKIINCKADTQNGPALGVDYERDRGMEADITILPNPVGVPNGNGSKHVATIIGSNHKIIFRRGEGLDTPEQDLLINIGGDNRTIGKLAQDENYRASNIEIINETGYPMILDDNTSEITGSTAGALVDEGTNNNVTIK
ncbi:MAG: right-handed parallel beta-helix repeat-containing protein, partial [Rikenellaceae bacterium]